MTDQATRVVPAGWYEDPASRAHVRWWNGLAWTEHTALKPSAPAQQQPHQAQQGTGQGYQHQQGYQQTSTGSTYTAETAARIAEARELERQYGISTAEHDIIVRRAAEGHTDGQGAYGQGAYGQDDHADVGSTRQAWSNRDDDGDEYDEYDEPGTATASAWFIAVWPVLTLVALAAAGYVAFFVASEPAVAGIPLIYLLVLVPLVLVIIWAAVDARKLRSLGHEAPSPALAVLGPLVYLIARRVKVAGSGPLVTLILLTLLVLGIPAAAVATGVSDRVGFALEVQNEVRAKYVDSGQLASVTCPLFIESISVGALYDCRGIMPDGSSRVVWVSVDSADGDFSTALAVK